MFELAWAGAICCSLMRMIWAPCLSPTAVALTHEIGHALGLQHPDKHTDGTLILQTSSVEGARKGGCTSSVIHYEPTDEPQTAGAIMQMFAKRGEGYLWQDDLDGLSALYPLCSSVAGSWPPSVGVGFISKHEKRPSTDTFSGSSNSLSTSFSSSPHYSGIGNVHSLSADLPSPINESDVSVPISVELAEMQSLATRVLHLVRRSPARDAGGATQDALSRSATKLAALPSAPELSAGGTSGAADAPPGRAALTELSARAIEPGLLVSGWLPGLLGDPLPRFLAIMLQFTSNWVLVRYSPQLHSNCCSAFANIRVQKCRCVDRSLDLTVRRRNGSHVTSRVAFDRTGLVPTVADAIWAMFRHQHTPPLCRLSRAWRALRGRFAAARGRGCLRRATTPENWLANWRFGNIDARYGGLPLPDSPDAAAGQKEKKKCLGS
ncbi:hypothetical protein T492DRAFT_1138663 [Pavlovales sp. CCMP2436]|nr:hypothetical protein T492DRAFT_1138663 [Pavlovales sp. CCMP2436]